MGAFTEYYVDPAGGNDTTGDGLTDGTAWATVQKALNTITQDATNGDRINVKAGSDDVLSSALTLATYGAPGIDFPLVFQGYTTAAGDRGIGGISGGGSVSIISDSVADYVHFVDMHLHNSGAVRVILLDNNCVFFHCEIDNTSSIGIDMDNFCVVADCYLHNLGIGTIMVSGCVYSNFYETGATNNFSAAAQFNSATGDVKFIHNIVKVTGAGDGVQSQGYDSIINNSIWSDGGTGQGIQISTGDNTALVLNNILEGFSAAGGDGINTNSATARIFIYGNNAFFNNEDELHQGTGHIATNIGNNLTLSASPFVDAANGDFRTNIVGAGAAFPSSYQGASTNQFMDIGAAQRKERIITSS